MVFPTYFFLLVINNGKEFEIGLLVDCHRVLILIIWGAEGWKQNWCIPQFF